MVAFAQTPNHHTPPTAVGSGPAPVVDEAVKLALEQNPASRLSG
jgi:hypothetical protein